MIDNVKVVRESTTVVFDLVKSLLVEAQEREAGPVYMTSFGGIESMQEYGITDIHVELIKQGCTIYQLWSRGISEAKLHQLIAALLRHYRFSPNYRAYMAGLSLPDSQMDLLIVPDLGAIQCFSNPDKGNSCIYLRDKESINVLYEHFQLNLRNASPLVLVSVEHQSSPHWEDLIVDTEKNLIGDRLQARENLTTLTEPLSIYGEKYRKGHPLDIAERLIKGQQSRVQALKDQIWHHRFMNIAERHVVEEYIATGWRPREQIKINPESVRQQVETEIEYLEKYQNYYLGLTEQKIPVAFEIKADRVLIEVIDPLLPIANSNRSGDAAAAVRITSDIMLKVFRSHFEALWDNTATEYKEKSSLIPWLRAQLRNSPFLAKVP